MTLPLDSHSGARARPALTSRVRARVAVGATLLSLATLAACNKDLATSSPLTAAGDQARFDVTTVPSHLSADSLRTLAASHGIVSLPVSPAVRTELVKLGQALLFDPILSGNRNMACMTCHLPAFGTGDRRNLSIGEGGIGFAHARWFCGGGQRQIISPARQRRIAHRGGCRGDDDHSGVF